MKETGTVQMSRSDNVKVAAGFSPRTLGHNGVRRGATLEQFGDFKRGYATRAFSSFKRGLKPTATITNSLRERGATFLLRVSAVK